MIEIFADICQQMGIHKLIVFLFGTCRLADQHEHIMNMMYIV